MQRIIEISIEGADSGYTVMVNRITKSGRSASRKLLKRKQKQLKNIEDPKNKR